MIYFAYFVLGIIYLSASITITDAIHPRTALVKLLMILVFPILSLQWFHFGFALIVFGFLLSTVLGYDDNKPITSQPFFALRNGYLANNIGFAFILIGLIALVARTFSLLFK